MASSSSRSAAAPATSASAADCTSRLQKGPRSDITTPRPDTATLPGVQQLGKLELN